MRLERLYDLARIVRVDHFGRSTRSYVEKLCLGIGFNRKCRLVVAKALVLVEKMQILMISFQKWKNIYNIKSPKFRLFFILVFT
jgi:hypothetical protein